MGNWSTYERRAMSTDVRVPTTGNAGEDAVIVDWNVALGQEVSVGDVIVTLETAKSTIDVEAPTAGHVLAIFYETGDEVPEHQVLAILGAPGEDVGAPPTPSAPLESHAEAPEESLSQKAPNHASTAQGIAAASGTEPSQAASPRSKILASRNGISLDSLKGSGPRGRIIVNDVLAAKRTLVTTNAQSLEAVASAPTAAQRPTESASEYRLLPVRGARKVTAQRMLSSLQSTAQVTLTRYANADALVRYAARLRRASENSILPRIGINDLLLFATARAVVKHPVANSWFDWDGIRQYSTVNLGFAVDTGSALLVPVIRNADSLSLAAIAGAARAAIDKARSGKLATPEMEEGTFTVSNLGGLGVHWFTPVLNPPQSCILGIGATHQTHPDGPSLIPLSLTFDHRALDGAAAALVLAEIANSIEIIDILAAF